MLSFDHSYGHSYHHIIFHCHSVIVEAGYIRENISVPAGVSSESFILDITDNDIVECKKSYSVTIESVSTCGVVIGSVNRSEVIIIDNDGEHISSMIHIMMYIIAPMYVTMHLSACVHMDS